MTDTRRRSTSSSAPDRSCDPPDPRISVVIPTLNEARNLPYVFARIPDDVFEVIVVDGGSVDDTPQVAAKLHRGVRVIGQTRHGKGNALACGFHAARGEIIVALDADGSTDPREIPRFVAALRGGAAYVKGTRFAPGGGSADITRLRRAGNRALNALANLMYGTKYTDLCYGYFAFWTRHLPILALDADAPPTEKVDRPWGDGFEIETLLTLRMTRRGLHAVEVPSYEARRIYGESNLRTLADGWRVLTVIRRERRIPAHRPTEPAPLPAPGRPEVQQ